jgi:hypothetical protein
MNPLSHDGVLSDRRQCDDVGTRLGVHARQCRSDPNAFLPIIFAVYKNVRDEGPSFRPSTERSMFNAVVNS